MFLLFQRNPAIEIAGGLNLLFYEKNFGAATPNYFNRSKAAVTIPITM